MLVCGGGASSGFLATSMRKAARKREIAMEVFAKSESDIDNFKNDIDVLLVGPHLQYLMEEVNAKLEGTSVIASLIENDIYGSLDGNRAVEKVLKLLEEREWKGLLILLTNILRQLHKKCRAMFGFRVYRMQFCRLYR